DIGWPVMIPGKVIVSPPFYELSWIPEIMSTQERTGQTIATIRPRVYERRLPAGHREIVPVGRVLPG
ncbi:unnamed protein product, partial [marine sediment metagenome]